METINIAKLIDDRYPSLFTKKPKFFKSITIGLFEKILHLKKVNSFIEKNSDVKNIEFIDEIFEMLNFSFRIANKDIKRIPSEGRLICVANHPIGSLDSLSLLKLISEIRTDVKIIANDVLMNIKNIEDLLLPFNLDSTSAQRQNLKAIGEVLEKEMAVIIFPAAEVSRLKWVHIRDGKWHKGPLYFSKKFNAPVLPIYVEAKNSLFFYLFSALHKGLSRVLLSHELFNKKNKTINIKVGDPIPPLAFTNNFINDKYQTKLLKKHVYLIAKNKSGIYKTEKNIIHPIDRKAIKSELNNSEIIGKTSDDKRLILASYHDSPNVLREIARLREVTFRKVGEGTGKKKDLDKFDKHYKHLVVWDENELEIVGSYRIGVGKDILKKFGKDGFYTSTIFNYEQDFINNYSQNSIELGRSFVQKKYWNTKALNYLWQGIGAFLSHHEYVKYMFGGVSISNSYPESAKKMIVYYFQKWFGSEHILANAFSRFSIPDTSLSKYNKLFIGKDYKEDYRILKTMLKPYGYTVPILYKHYSELCYEGGVKFLDFAVDESFENCVDGLILVDVSLIKDEKRERYISSHKQNLLVTA